MAAHRVARSRGARAWRTTPKARSCSSRTRCPARRCASRVQAAQEQLGAGDAGRACAARARSASCRAARTSASAAAARCSTCTSRRRSRPSSARSRTRSGISARSGPSACCGRSKARPGAIGSAPGCRCATSSRRARCWSASTSASRASSPTSRAATCCRGTSATCCCRCARWSPRWPRATALPQIELAVGDARSRRWCCATSSRSATTISAGCARSRAAHDVQWWLQPKGPDTAQPLDGGGSGARLHAARVRRAHAVPADRLHAGQPATSTRALVSRALRLLAPAPGDVVIDWFCGLGNFTLPLATPRARACSASRAARALVERRARPRRR